MTAPRPGILLDRDGTIIVDHGYVGSVDRIDFIDGAAEAIASFNEAGIPVAVVTNQAGVARGLYGLDDVARVHEHIAEYQRLRHLTSDLVEVNEKICETRMGSGETEGDLKKRFARRGTGSRRRR